MSWEQADLIFPLGMVQLPNGQLISNEELKHSDIKTIYHTTSFNARNMLTNRNTYVWGKDGEFTNIVDYNALNLLPRPDYEHPALNVYGMRMLRDYMILHDIETNT